MLKERLGRRNICLSLGLRPAKAPYKKKLVSYSSLSSSNFQNRNSLLFKNARKMLDVGVVLGRKLVGRRTFNLKCLVEMEEEEIAEREEALKNNAELEEGEFSGKEDDASLSLEF